MGYCTRSEYPHRLLISAINSLFLFGAHTDLTQVLLLRALNLTEAGGY